MAWSLTSVAYSSDLVIKGKCLLLDVEQTSPFPISIFDISLFTLIFHAAEQKEASAKDSFMPPHHKPANLHVAW